MNVKEQAKWRWDHVAKPLNSLGCLEDLVVQIAQVQNTADVRIDKRCAVVFCGDHGVVEEGVSQSGSEVTALVARSVAEGTANINLMAGAASTDVFAVDMGMCTPIPGVWDYRCGSGTQNMTKGPAMTRMQAEKALCAGKQVMHRLKTMGYQLAVIGEMGIGNTTATSAMASILLDMPVEELTGRGAGLSDAGLVRKIDAIHRAIRVNQPKRQDPVDVLSKLGGFEIAGMAGACLGALETGIPVIIDGVIPAVAALTAVRMQPEARMAILPAQISKEPADVRMMQEMNMEPMIHARMALGEGTGAVMLIPMLDMALRVYHGPHTFDDLGMEAYTPQEGKA